MYRTSENTQRGASVEHRGSWNISVFDDNQAHRGQHVAQALCRVWPNAHRRTLAEDALDCLVLILIRVRLAAMRAHVSAVLFSASAIIWAVSISKHSATTSELLHGFSVVVSTTEALLQQPWAASGRA